MAWIQPIDSDGLKGGGLITSTAGHINFFQVSWRCGQVRDMSGGKLFTWPDNIEVPGLIPKFLSSECELPVPV